jgi:hypothetical protein
MRASSLNEADHGRPCESEEHTGIFVPAVFEVETPEGKKLLCLQHYEELLLLHD